MKHMPSNISQILFSSLQSGTTNLSEFCHQDLTPKGCIIFMCTSGKADVTINRKTYRFRHGSLSILFFGVSMRVNNFSDDFNLLYVNVPPYITVECFKQINTLTFWDFIFMYPIFRIKKNHQDLFTAWFTQINWSINICQNNYAKYITKSMLDSFMMGVDTELQKENAYKLFHIKKNHGWVLADRFISLVAVCFRQHKDVVYYANKLCITPDYLNKLIRKHIEMTPKELIDTYLINEIKNMLVNTSLGIKAISAELNFEDPPYLARFFRRNTGMSPLEYRKKNQM